MSTPTKYGIAYSGMADIDQPVKVLALQNHANSQVYAPTYREHCLSRLPAEPTDTEPEQEARPRSRPGPGGTDPVLISKQGQRVVSKQGVFLPLRDRQAAESARPLRDLP